VSDSPRLFFVNRVYWPAGEATAQLLTDLAEGLAARGWTVHVVTAGEGDTVHRGVTIHRTATPDRHGGLVARAWNYRCFLSVAVRQLAALTRPGDIVVTLTDPPMLGVRVVAGLAGRDVRVVQWIQDIYPEIATAHYGKFLGRLLKSWKRQRDEAWRASAACVTLGEDMAAVIAAAGVPATRVAIIPNWAPRELDAAPPSNLVATRREQWRACGRFVVVYSGNLGRVHEFDTVLAAIAALQDNPNVTFHFIGRGPRMRAIAQAAHARGLRQLEFHPPVAREELPALLAAADAHLVTLQPAFGSLVYPSKLAGVLAAGRPTLFVGPTTGDIARLLRTQDCGAAFAPGDASGLAAVIAHWAAERAIPERLGRNARRAYAEGFTRDAALNQWDARLQALGRHS